MGIMDNAKKDMSKAKNMEQAARQDAENLRNEAEPQNKDIQDVQQSQSQQ